MHYTDIVVFMAMSELKGVYVRYMSIQHAVRMQ